MKVQARQGTTSDSWTLYGKAWENVEGAGELTRAECAELVASFRLSENGTPWRHEYRIIPD